MGRDRVKNRRLPKGWQPAPNGVIYFRPTNALDREIVKSITGGPLSLRLGTEAEAPDNTEWLKVVAGRRRQEPAALGTVSEICQRAQLEYLPKIKNAKTREERERHINALEEKFGKRRYALNVFDASRDSAAIYLRAMDVQRHIFEGTESRPVGVNREVRTWELLFQWARAPWGLTEYNPCAGLKMNDEEPRAVVPEDTGIFKLYRELEPPARFMVAMIRYYGRRKVELLGLQLADARDDALYLTRGKDRTGRPKKIIRLEWDPRLRKMWARLMRWRDQVKRGGKVEELTAAILNRHGRRYTVTAFNSARKRGMERAGIAGAFTFHDMRKSRAEDGLTLDEAANVLAHDDKRTTARAYRPNAPVVVNLNAEVAKKRGAK